MKLNTPSIIFNIGYHSKEPSMNWSDSRKASYRKQRDFYSCKTPNENILDYCIRSCERDSEKKADMTAFTESGEMTVNEMQDMKNVLQKTDSTIWHSIISFKEDFGTRAVPTKKHAQEFVQSQMKRFLSQTHLDPKNVDWFASYHNDTNNNHVHIVFFEKEPKTIDRNGKVDYTHKGNIGENAILNSLLNFEEYFSERKNDIFTQRDMMISVAKNSANVNSQSYIEISKLASELPRSGRLSYNSEHMKPFKEKIDKAVTLLLNENPQLKAKYINLLEAVDQREKRYIQYAQRNEVKDSKLKMEQFGKLRSDINARLGNVVLSIAKEYKQNEETAQRKIKAEKDRLSKLQSISGLDKSRKRFKTAKKVSRTSRNSVLKVMKRLLAPTGRQDYLTDFYERLEEIKYEQEQNLDKGGNMER